MHNILFNKHGFLVPLGNRYSCAVYIADGKVAAKRAAHLWETGTPQANVLLRKTPWYNPNTGEHKNGVWSVLKKAYSLKKDEDLLAMYKEAKENKKLEKAYMAWSSDFETEYVKRYVAVAEKYGYEAFFYEGFDRPYGIKCEPMMTATWSSVLPYHTKKEIREDLEAFFVKLDALLKLFSEGFKIIGGTGGLMARKEDRKRVELCHHEIWKQFNGKKDRCYYGELAKNKLIRFHPFVLDGVAY